MLSTIQEENKNSMQQSLRVKGGASVAIKKRNNAQKFKQKNSPPGSSSGGLHGSDYFPIIIEDERQISTKQTRDGT